MDVLRDITDLRTGPPAPDQARPPGSTGTGPGDGTSVPTP